MKPFLPIHVRALSIGAMFSMALFVSFAGWSQSEQSAAAQGALEITSPLGRQLYALPDNSAVITARTTLAADPKNSALVLQLSKAEASRRQYQEAVAACTEGLANAAQDADLYIERGHRLLGLRKFSQAQHDLEQATKLDPSKLDAYYHLGLAYYFQGLFAQAAIAFGKARALAKTDDSLIDCSNWLYVSLRRANDERQAAAVLARITPEVHNTEPHLLFYLRLLHFYQGQLTEEAVLPPKPAAPDDTESELSFNTVSYGVGNWKLYHGDIPGATVLFRSVVTGQAWNAWGFIGSETELARLAR